jgi:hypothetical protein
MTVGLVQLAAVFKTRLSDYIVFYLTMTTKNCFEHATRLPTRLTGKIRTSGLPHGSFHPTFFSCNIRPKSAILFDSGLTANIFGKRPF